MRSRYGISSPPPEPTSPAHAAFLKNLHLKPVQFYWAIVVAMGVQVSDMLGEFAEHRIYSSSRSEAEPRDSVVSNADRI